MVFEVGLQLDTPEQCATRYPTQHIPAPSDQHSTVFPCGQSLEEMQNIDVSMQKGAKLTVGCHNRMVSESKICLMP